LLRMLKGVRAKSRVNRHEDREAEGGACHGGADLDIAERLTSQTMPGGPLRCSRISERNDTPVQARHVSPLPAPPRRSAASPAAPDQRAPRGDDRRPSIKSESDWRVRTDSGSLRDMGCLLAGAGGNRRWFRNPQRGCTQPNFPASLGLHLRPGLGCTRQSIRDHTSMPGPSTNTKFDVRLAVELKLRGAAIADGWLTGARCGPLRGGAQKTLGGNMLKPLLHRIAHPGYWHRCWESPLRTQLGRSRRCLIHRPWASWKQCAVLPRGSHAAVPLVGSWRAVSGK
jgi:hypothetical protein